MPLLLENSTVVSSCLFPSDRGVARMLGQTNYVLVGGSIPAY